MRIFWTYKAVPELAGLDRNEITRLVILTRWRPFEHWQYWSAAMVCLLVYLAGLWLVVSVIDNHLIGACISGASIGISIFIMKNLALKYQIPHIKRMKNRTQAELDLNKAINPLGK